MVIMILSYEPSISLHVQTHTHDLQYDTDCHVTGSTDTDSCVTCSKKKLFINCVQLQGFPIDPIH